MNKTTRLVLVALLAVVAGWLVYQQWSSRRPTDAWAFIPANAAVVLEARDLPAWRQENQSKAVWANLATLPAFRTGLERLDSLAAMSRRTNRPLADFLKGRLLTASLHVTARDDFDYLFFVPAGEFGDQGWLNRMLTQFENNPAYRTDAHTFQGFRIREIKSRRSPETVFSYILHERYLIGSYTPFLVEDAVRTIQDESAGDGWAEIRGPLAGGAGSDPVRVYVNPARLPQWVAGMVATEGADLFRSLSTVARGGSLSLASENDRIGLSGELRTREEAVDWLDIFRDQAASPPRLTGLVPDETAVLLHWSFEDARRLRDALDRYAARHDPSAVRAQTEAREKYGLRVSEVYGWVGREIALGLLDNQGEPSNRLLFVEAQDPGAALDQLGRLAAEADRRQAAPPYAERYANVTIRQISIPQFPVCAFGSLFGGWAGEFPQCFYAPVGNHVVFSDHVVSLKRLLDGVAAGRVWENSVPQRTFLEEDAAAANFSAFVHTGPAWEMLRQNASPTWRATLTTHAALFRRFERAALRVTRRGDAYETTLRFAYRERTISPAVENRFVVNNRVAFEYPLRTPVFVVRNPEDQSYEMLVQDEANQLHFVSGAGRRIGQKQLDGPLVSSVQQLLPPDGPPQFVFATAGRLGLLNRNGGWATGFPIALPDSATLHTLAVLDYDRSGDYRFAVSDIGGNLYLFDHRGILLDGWRPRPLDDRLSTPVRHVRVRDRDYLLATQTDGTVHAFNRRGQSYPGFPLRLRTRVSSPLHVEAGLTDETTRLTTVTDYGELVQLDLTGKVRRREQWARPAGDATFRLWVEAGGRDWVVSRQSEGKLALIDRNASLLFEKAVTSPRGVICQYYDFGTDRKIFALTSPGEKRTFLYGPDGTPVGNGAVASQFPVSVVYSDAFSKLLVFRASGPEAGVWTVKIR
ncbi:MAG: hypothetical protein H7Z75_03270 [Ferruginibacter sp.]|nr:hypothetical protein [Cytophagales bacterium]